MSDKALVITNKLRDNDMGNAERFYEKFKGRLIYIAELNTWHEWKQDKWSGISFDKVISDYAKLVAKDLWKEVAELDDSKDREALTRHAKRTHDERQLRAMVNTAKGEFSRSLREFDNRTHWFNCKNGVLNFEKDPKEMTLNNIRMPAHSNMCLI